MLVYAMDGLFGLPRKRSAGTSHQNALHDHLYFHNQIDVDRFVREAQRGKKFANVSNILCFVLCVCVCVDPDAHITLNFHSCSFCTSEFGGGHARHTFPESRSPTRKLM